jgi:hypothetical protein
VTEPDCLRSTRASYDAVAADYAERFRDDWRPSHWTVRCSPGSPKSCRPPVPGRSHWTEAFGHAISLDFHRRQPDSVAELLSQAGLVVRARLMREPDEDGDFPEKTPQAFLLARKPADAGRP